MKKVQTTAWLDLLTYILIPIIGIIGVLNIFRASTHIDWEFYSMFSLISEIILLLFYGGTAYYTHKRDKKAYFLLQFLIVIAAIRASIDFANTRNFNNGDNFIVEFILYFGICFIAWIYPNYIYLKKRKNLFVSRKSKDNREIQKENEESKKQNKEKLTTEEEEKTHDSDEKENNKE